MANILIIDDDKTVNKMLAKMVNGLGHDATQYHQAVLIRHANHPGSSLKVSDVRIVSSMRLS